MPPSPRSYVKRNNDATKSSASQAVANFLIRSFCPFRNSAKTRIAPRAGSQVTMEMMLCVNTSVLVQLKFSVHTEKILKLKDLNQIQRDGNKQPDHHNHRVIRSETRLRGAHHRRHQPNDEAGERIDQTIDQILVRAAGDAAGQTRQPRSPSHAAAN